MSTLQEALTQLSQLLRKQQESKKKKLPNSTRSNVNHKKNQENQVKGTQK